MSRHRALTFFDRINLAHCAAERATENLLDKERWEAEYDTSQAWANYKHTRWESHAS